MLCVVFGFMPGALAKTYDRVNKKSEPSYKKDSHKNMEEVN